MAIFGYSQLAFYVKCPFRFYLERVKRVEVPLDERRHYIGTVLAIVLDTFYKSQRWRSANPLPLMAADVQAAAATVDTVSTCPWLPGERDQKLAEATSLLPTILDTLRQERLLGLRTFTELDVEIRLGKDRVVGRPDLVIESPAGEPGLWVVDGKAGGTLGRHVSTNQLRFYALGLVEHQRFQRPPDRAGFWWFRHGTVVWKKVTMATLDKFRTSIVETIQRLRDKDFQPKPSADCRLCDVRAHCPTGQAYLQARVAGKVALEIDGNLGVVSL